MAAIRRNLCRLQRVYSSAAAIESTTGGVKDYEDYRRSLYGDITHKALLVDAVGTLLVPSQPMAQVPSFSFFRVSNHYNLWVSELNFFYLCLLST